RRNHSNMRDIDHPVALVQRGDLRLAAQHQALHLGLLAYLLRQELIHADAGADAAAAFEGGTREKVAGLRAVNPPLACFRVVQATDEEHLVLEFFEGLKDLAYLEIAT